MSEQWKYVIRLNWVAGPGTPASSELSCSLLYASYRSTKHSNSPGITYLTKKKWVQGMMWAIIPLQNPFRSLRRDFQNSQHTKKTTAGGRQPKADNREKEMRCERRDEGMGSYLVRVQEKSSFLPIFFHFTLSHPLFWNRSRQKTFERRWEEWRKRSLAPTGKGTE